MSLLHLSFVLLVASLFARAETYTTIKLENERGGFTGDSVSTGIITPLDQEMKNFYIRNADGVIEVKLTPDAVIGLQAKVTKDQLKKRKISFKAGEQHYSYQLPEKLYVRRQFKDAQTVQDFLNRGEMKLALGKIYTTKLPDHLPTADEPWISGMLTEVTDKFMKVKVHGEPYLIRTDSHDRMQRIMGLFTHKDIKPFSQQAYVYGKRVDHVFHASEVGLKMLEDSSLKDDPQLGRYLFIGDSISGNYDRSLRTALKGKLNIYHPPVNCGASGRGVKQIGMWLGAHDQPGQNWDIISFNFGHWDCGNSKDVYQSNLELIISELKKTKAKLIYVTTAPVPNGYAGPEPLTADGKAPGRTRGVMKNYLNPWALEVMARHPEINICDQHKLISSEKFYATWLAKAGQKDGKASKEYGDVHIGGLLGEPVGRQLARKVLDVLGRTDEALHPHGISKEQLAPERQRGATKNIDAEDFLDLLESDSRLRKY